MPEIIPDHVPSPRTALFWDGVAYRPGHIDAAGDLQIDVLSSVMDPLAATAAAQALALAQLQLIEDLRDALQSVATDRLIVRGEDQVFSFKGVLASSRTMLLTAPDGNAESNPVPAGEIWCVTDVGLVDNTTANTRRDYTLLHDGVGYLFAETRVALAVGQFSYQRTWKWLDPGDEIYASFVGGLVGDSCIVVLTGYIMTLET